MMMMMKQSEECMYVWICEWKDVMCEQRENKSRSGNRTVF